MWVKICGIRDVETAERVAALAPDAIGLNFYDRSPRCVSSSTARKIVSVLPTSVASAGVFVNHSAAEIEDVTKGCGLTLVQLHGDEPPELVAELQALLPETPILRAWRMGDDLNDLAEYLAECGRQKLRLAGCLIDAKVKESFGGTGQSPPWDVLRAAYRRAEWPPLILAGGLTAENVAQGIAAVQPWGVDVASGVEASPGVKDVGRVAAFVHAARKARW